MNARFYAPGAQAPGELVTLPGDEVQHLTRVLRLKAGAAVRIFNGRGGEFEGCVERAARDVVEVRVGAPHDAAREPAVAITLAQAVLKGDGMDGVIRDTVMLGVAAVQPIVTTRTEVSLATLERGHRRERWERIAVSSAKQCGRAVVPAILDPKPFDLLPGSIGDLQLPGPALMLVEPGASPEAVGLRDLDGAPPREATLVVGPEGGWTIEEIAAAAGRCRLLTLGERTIRADAMATIAMAALFARWGEY